MRHTFRGISGYATYQLSLTYRLSLLRNVGGHGFTISYRAISDSTEHPLTEADGFRTAEHANSEARQRLSSVVAAAHLDPTRLATVPPCGRRTTHRSRYKIYDDYQRWYLDTAVSGANGGRPNCPRPS
ncbi:hypothetical protein [Nocardia suismassiliense]|uniref:hypothetical protein n=1 Tax=Nocardia suismassiliense TaxID=2077092 RepID=UPI000D1FAA04|nr:hypothetical protein [Nocardia suismassiliense]